MRSNKDKKGQTIILIHGIGVSEKYFRPLAETLATDYHVVSINLPGWAKTSKPKKPLSLDELADVLTEFIRQLRINKPILIGQSMGCQIVMRVVAKRPELASKIILMGPTVNKDERSAQRQMIRLLQDGLREPPTLNWILVTDYLRFGIRRYLRTAQFMLDDAIEKSVRDSQLPVLIIRGSNDKIVPRNWTSYLQSTSTIVTFKEINGPHNVHYIQPQKVASLCRHFIEI